MDQKTLLRKIAARKQAGMTAEQYQSYLQAKVDAARIAVYAANQQVIYAGCTGTDRQIDRAVATAKSAAATLTLAKKNLKRGYE